jgi:hypothetical protein
MQVKLTASGPGMTMRKPKKTELSRQRTRRDNLFGRAEAKGLKEFRKKFVAGGQVTWRIYAVALILVGIGVVVDRQVPGISRSLGSSGAAVLGIIIVKRRYWHYRWFWITFTVLFILQFPLILLTKPLMDYLKFVFMWIFALVDLFAMSLAIEFIADYVEERPE